MTVLAAKSRWKPRWKSWRIFAVLVGIGILVVAGTRNYPTSQARVPVVGHVVEIRPEVDGPVLAVAAEPNILVRKGSVLLQIDPAPYQARLKQLETDLAAAHEKIAGLRSELRAAGAALETIQAQYDDIARELSRLERRPGLGTGTEFRLLYVTDEQALLAAQLDMAKAQAANAQRAFDAQIGAANLAAARLAVQLADARAHVDQATIRAPADGYVSKIAVAVGARAVTTRSAVSFIPADQITDRERFLAGESPAPKSKHGRKHRTLAGRFRTLLH